MKKVMCAILIVSLIVVMGPSALATGTEKVTLSELSAEESIAFLVESGVTIPDIFEDELAWSLFIREVIAKVENNPNVVFLYNSSIIYKFANEIKNAVNEYYGVSACASVANTRSAQDVLQDSILYGSWNDSYLNYNCYGYAIGVEDLIDPGVYDWISKGNDKSTYFYNWYANINTIASWVEEDLEARSYTVNVVSQTMPNTNVGDHLHLICVRKDDDGVPIADSSGNLLYYFHDYHFMKLGTSGKWYHKPGQTQPLVYKYVPTNSRAWLCEGYDGKNKVALVDESTTYDSGIFYIEYSTPHIYEYRRCGVGQHIKTCTICGITTGSALNCVYVNGTCRICGSPQISEAG